MRVKSCLLSLSTSLYTRDKAVIKDVLKHTLRVHLTSQSEEAFGLEPIDSRNVKKHDLWEKFVVKKDLFSNIKNSEAKSIMLQAMTEAIIDGLPECNTANDMWKALQDNSEGTCDERVQRAQKEFCTTQFKKSDTILDFAICFDEIVSKMIAAQVKVPEKF